MSRNHGDGRNAGRLPRKHQRCQPRVSTRQRAMMGGSLGVCDTEQRSGGGAGEKPHGDECGLRARPAVKVVALQNVWRRVSWSEGGARSARSSLSVLRQTSSFSTFYIHPIHEMETTRILLCVNQSAMVLQENKYGRLVPRKYAS